MTSLVTTPLSIMAPRPDGFEAVWGVSRLSRGQLEWRTSRESGEVRMDRFGMTPQGDEVLRVRAEGLPLGRTVEVRAITEAVGGPTDRHVTEWRRVHLPDADAGAALVVIWNDTHQQDETIQALDDLSPAADLLVWNGDLCNDWKTPDEFTPTLLSPAGRDITANRPLALTIGNHDVRGDWAFRLQSYAAMPEGRPYYSVRVGPVACIMLHTGEDKPDDHPTFRGRVAMEQLRAEQTAWLRDEIQRPGIRDAPYRAVFCHIPLRWIDETPVDYDAEGYDWFSRTSRDAWHDSLVEWGAQLIVSGHTHYRSMIPADAAFPYAQVIGGGPVADPGDEEAATWIELAADERELVLTMQTLDGATALRATFMPVTE
ncbi:MAG: metallophosphoesterase [Microbacterium sp.]|jgi:predicted phosphodiesterase|nr:metallophosphoesterase [Microbacterium sp.]